MRTKILAPLGVAVVPAIPGLWALCTWQAKRARGGERPFTTAIPGTGRVGVGLRGPAVRVTWMGDSLAAGLGCGHLTETPAHLSARLLERPVDVSMLAVPGSRVVHVLRDQLPLLSPDAELVVVSVGANDVTCAGPRSNFARQLDELLTHLAPTPVVLLTLPDMAMPDRMAQPLRALAGARARWFDAARARVAARHPHVTSVDIASRPAGLSRNAGRRLLCADKFHPGPEGYRVWAERIATACHAILEPAGESRRSASV